MPWLRGVEDISHHSSMIAKAILLFGLLWGWQNIVLFLPDYHPDNPDLLFFWHSYNYFAVILFAIAWAVAPMIQRHLDNPLFKVGSSGCACMGTIVLSVLLFAIDDSGPTVWWLFQITDLVLAVSIVLIDIQLVSVLLSFQSWGDRALITTGGIVMNLFFYLLANSFPLPAVIALTIALPPLIGLLLVNIKPLPGAKRALRQGQAEQEGFPSKAVVPFFGVVFLFGFSISFIRSIVISSEGVSPFFAQPEVVATTLVILLFAIICEALVRYYRKVTIAPFLVDGLITASIVLYFCGILVPSVLLPLTFAGFSLYIAVLYQMVAKLAGEDRSRAVRITAAGFTVNNLGIALGTLLVHFMGTNLSAPALLIAFILAYGLFLAACLMFSQALSPARFLPKPSPSRSDADDVAKAPVTLLKVLERNSMLLAEREGLTKRESEIAFMLSRGKSAKAIASDFGVSVNTVKTHVTHIYQKLDIHSHEELIGLLEEIDSV